MARFDLRLYARRGAEARLAELNAELAEIYQVFPELRQRGGRASRKIRPNQGAGLGVAGNVSFSPPARKRKRKPMTAAQRKAVGERMKKYWATRRNRTK